MDKKTRKFNKKEIELQTKICERVRKYFEENNKNLNTDTIVESVKFLGFDHSPFISVNLRCSKKFLAISYKNFSINGIHQYDNNTFEIHYTCNDVPIEFLFDLEVKE